MTDQQRSRRRSVQGTVSSDKMDKTITVSVERLFKHPKYKKYIRQHSKVYAHDEQGKAKVGDIVKVVECRPMSKLKRFALVEVVQSTGSAQ